MSVIIKDDKLRSFYNAVCDAIEYDRLSKGDAANTPDIVANYRKALDLSKHAYKAHMPLDNDPSADGRRIRALDRLLRESDILFDAPLRAPTEFFAGDIPASGCYVSAIAGCRMTAAAVYLNIRDIAEWSGHATFGKKLAVEADISKVRADDYLASAFGEPFCAKSYIADGYTLDENKKSMSFFLSDAARIAIGKAMEPKPPIAAHYGVATTFGARMPERAISSEKPVDHMALLRRTQFYRSCDNNNNKIRLEKLIADSFGKDTAVEGKNAFAALSEACGEDLDVSPLELDRS